MNYLVAKFACIEDVDRSQRRVVILQPALPVVHPLLTRLEPRHDDLQPKTLSFPYTIFSVICSSSESPSLRSDPYQSIDTPVLTSAQ